MDLWIPTSFVLAGVSAAGAHARAVRAMRATERLIAREQRDLAGLRRLAQAVASQDDAREAVVHTTAELAGAAFASLCEAEPDRECLTVTAATLPHLCGRRLPLRGDPSGAVHAFITRESFFVADGRGHPAVNQELTEIVGGRSFLYHPVEVEGDVAAVLVVGWAEDIGSLQSRRADLVALAGDEAAVALRRLDALRRLEAAALTDPLTGIANRRAFDAELPLELARSRRTGAPLAVAIMDLNGFKALNDSEGHAAGDLMLQAVAGAWLAELRGTDKLARLGGDEFAALLPACGEDDAPALRARLHRAVPHPAGSAIGIAVWDGREDAASLLRRADRAVYASKARRGTTAAP